MFSSGNTCSTRYKSGTRIQYPTLAVYPMRSFKCPHRHYPAACAPSREWFGRGESQRTTSLEADTLSPLSQSKRRLGNT